MRKGVRIHHPRWNFRFEEVKEEGGGGKRKEKVIGAFWLGGVGGVYYLPYTLVGMIQSFE